jgi:hypothetical protein
MPRYDVRYSRLTAWPLSSNEDTAIHPPAGGGGCCSKRINWTWQLAELFKIEHGKIRRIEAVLQRVPYGMNSEWSTYERGISEEIQSVR